MLPGRAGEPIACEDWLSYQVQRAKDQPHLFPDQAAFPQEKTIGTLDSDCTERSTIIQASQQKGTSETDMSLLSSSFGSVYYLPEETDNNMLQDLQLAAQLGKTLLERNKELENMVKLHHTTVEEQAQEIEYMKKQSAALREVNDSRMKIYEQLEVSIQDLERANHRLVLENKNDKKVIKNQTITIENLEARVEEIQKKLDELNEQYESLLRQQTVSQSTNTTQAQTSTTKGSVTAGGSTQEIAVPYIPKSFDKVLEEPHVQQYGTTTVSNDSEVAELLIQLQEARNQRAREQKKVEELGQQLANLLQENSSLEEQLSVLRTKAQDVKNLQDEISTLEEVRKGQLCARCFRGIDALHDELSVMLDQEEYDDISMVESYINDNQHETDSVLQETNNKTGEEGDRNPYWVLVEKYQALLEVQRRSLPRLKNGGTPGTCMSLQEELKMSAEFNSLPTPSTETESQQESTKSNATSTRTKVEICNKKPFSATSTDFSEAETSSSGFSDETSNKTTQTENPGSFLCSIADGKDCKFSIYDDNNPFESRFRKTPEYRELFKEIFSVLKRAAEASDEGEKLPLLDTSNSTTSTQEQSPIATQEDIPSEATDDNQSVISSVVCSVVSEPPYRIQTSTQSNGGGLDYLSVTTHQSKGDSRHGNEKKFTQQNGGGLDYLSVHVTKRSGKHSTNRRLFHNESKQTTPDVVPTTNPRFVPAKSHSGGKRRLRAFTAADQNDSIGGGYVHTNRTKESPTYGRKPNSYKRNNNAQHNNSFECREYKPSTASADVARLKQLEMSYAEVLQLPNKSKANNHHRNNYTRNSWQREKSH